MSTSIRPVCIRCRNAIWFLVAFSLTSSHVAGAGVGSAESSEATDSPIEPGRSKPVSISIRVCPFRKMGFKEQGPPQKEAPNGSLLDLPETVRHLKDGVFLVGNSEGGYGTAFVISKEHRLLATNAHVADIGHETGLDLLAIRNGSADVYEVERIAYHPGLLRNLAGSLPIRSMNPYDGEVLPHCADVAVLQLGSGPDLPVEFELATPEEVKSCFARPVAMLGFPGHDMGNWPEDGEKAVATFRQGVISRLTDFDGNADVPIDKAQRAQHTMENWFGFSGAPIFLPNGHVILINHSTGVVSPSGPLPAQLSFGIRVDCLWESSAYHHADWGLPIPIDKSDLRLHRFFRSDPNGRDFRRAVQLQSEGLLLGRAGQYDEAIKKCNEAISLAPAFAEAYYRRWACYYGSWASQTSVIHDPKREDLLGRALDDLEEFLAMMPSDPRGPIAYARTLTAMRRSTGNNSCPEAVRILTALLESDRLDREARAAALSVRAWARGLEHKSLSDIDEAIRPQPFDAAILAFRRFYWAQHGRIDLALEDHTRELELRAAETDATEAFRLAYTTTQGEFCLTRFFSLANPEEAIELARKACEATEYKYFDHLLILGRVCARAGDYEEAVKWYEKALQLAPAKHKPSIRRMLKTARGRQSLRDCITMLRSANSQALRARTGG